MATVTRSYKDRTVITEINGRENVELAVFKEADANTILVARRVHERLEDIHREYGASSGINLEIITDQSRFIEQSISEVLKTAIIGGLLAVIILFVFLQRAGATVIIGMAIPNLRGGDVLLYVPLQRISEYHVPGRSGPGSGHAGR